jgi:ferredoxin
MMGGGMGGCGVCIYACPEGAITVDDIAMIDAQKCTGCGPCIDECPNEAISLPN